MRFLLFTGLIIVSISLAKAQEIGSKKDSNLSRLEDFNNVNGEANSEQFDVQRKRDSENFYSRPDRLTATNNKMRIRGGLSSARGRLPMKYSSQINRPFNTYGPPSHQNSPMKTPATQSQPNREHHFNQQFHSNNNNALSNQGVPSPIRHVDFVEQSPIATQNNVPFGPNSANYLPPKNQKLPAYSAPNAFSLDSFEGIRQDQNQEERANLQSQNLIRNENPQQISDAALFLSQNAQAIQQLYNAPAINQDFAPGNEEEINDLNNQLQKPNAQLQELFSATQSPLGFSGPLPAYASGTLNPEETLEQIQSTEKDRLIAQLQQALAAQTSPQVSGRYAQNHANYVQNEKFLTSVATEFPSFDQSTKFQGLTQHNTGSVPVSANLPFGQSFFPTTTIGPPAFHPNYGASTTTQTPAVTTVQSSIPTLQPPRNPKGDGASQSGAPVPRPPHPGLHSSAGITGIPIYGGFVPTYITGNNFIPSFLGPAPITPVQLPDSPTHFGIPFPAVFGQKPSGGGSVPQTPSSAAFPGHPGPPVTTPPIHSPPTPARPAHPVATPVHPSGPPAHHPSVPSLQPVQPVQIPTAIAPVQPTYGIQSVINPFLYKPVKPVYPVYYYPNVAYQIQKPAAPTYPWSYAPTYTQAKPVQIWK
ncbi:proline-rich protein 36-like [Prorops nasuta]|uniref:proline-rich protein 36-like n=1 Tax=Prorops nasuta TaxID=863751 RepID=UPI0034CE967E